MQISNFNNSVLIFSHSIRITDISLLERVAQGDAERWLYLAFSLPPGRWLAARVSRVCGHRVISALLVTVSQTL